MGISKKIWNACKRCILWEVINTHNKAAIVVCGATGNQGGAVVDSLLASGKWNVFAMVRDVSGEKARALEAKGVQLKKGDLLDKASLVSAFQAAHGVFGLF